MIEIDLPRWAFDASCLLAKARSDHFLNRFYNDRLRRLHDSTCYRPHVESIAGYMGEIGAALAFGIDPEEALHAMILATRGMTRRDSGDLEHDGWSIDVKIEDFGHRHAAVLAGRTRPDQDYGCRLVNLDQFDQNGDKVDHYLFGVFDPPLTATRRLHQARRIAWLGCATREQVRSARHGSITPSGRSLRSPAKFIPHSSLRQPETLFQLPSGPRKPRPIELTTSEACRAERIRRRLTDIADGRQARPGAVPPRRKEWNSQAEGSTMK